MSINRLDAGGLTPQNLLDIKTHINAIEQIIRGRIIDLDPEERRKHGSVNEINKLFINKVEDVLTNYPDFTPPRFDMLLFKAEKEQREILEQEIDAVAIVSYQLISAKIAYDFNNYKAALSVYAYMQFLAEQFNDSTAAQIVADLKEFFPRSKPEADKNKPDTNRTKSDEDKPKTDADNNSPK